MNETALRWDGLVVSMPTSHVVGPGFIPHRDGLVVSMSISHVVGPGFIPHRDGLVVSMSISHVVSHGFTPQPGHTKERHKNVTNRLSARHAGIG